MPAPRATCYAAILDAGSSGTRIYLYRWKAWHKADPSPPQIEEVFNTKQEPGLSGIFEVAEINLLLPLNEERTKTVQQRVNGYLAPLYAHGRTFFAGAGVDLATVPIFLLATAGMRVLKAEHLDFYGALLECTKTSINSSGFKPEECGTITGEAEALYGWIAANYSLGFFSGYGSRSKKSVGYVEMGGESAQIAYRLVRQGDSDTAIASRVANVNRAEAALLATKKQPYPHLAVEANQALASAIRVEAARAALAEEDHGGGLDNYNGRVAKVNIGEMQFDLFLGSYPLGVNAARKRYYEVLDSRSQDDAEIDDPAKYTGWELVPTIPGRKLIKGSGKFLMAESIISHHVRAPLYDHLPPDHEKPDRQVVQSPSRSFVAGSNFWYSTRGVFGLDQYGEPLKTHFTFADYRKEVELAFGLNWNTVLAWRGKVPKKFLEESGFTAVWIQSVLFEAFHFSQSSRHAEDVDGLAFRPYNGSNGLELSWTLGRVVLWSMDKSKPQQMMGQHARQMNDLQRRLEIERSKAARAEYILQDMQYVGGQGGGGAALGGGGGIGVGHYGAARARSK